MIKYDYLRLQEAVRFFHSQIDRGTFRGWNCSCDYEFTKMLAFKETYDKWLS